MATIGTLVAYLQIDVTSLKKSEKQAKKSFGNIEDYAKSAATAVAGIFAGMAIADIAKDLVKTADTMKLLEGRLKLVTDSQEDFTKAQESLFNISNKTRTSFESTLTLYTRMARSARDTGQSQEDMLAVTEAINKAVTVSGANTVEATQAMIQFSQGLGEGTLRGEEMNSVLSQTPRVAQLIADGLGVTTAQLRKMGSEGELTPEKIIKAILKQKDVIDREFNAMPKTVGQAITVMNNHFQRFIREFDKASGVTDKIISGIDSMTAALGGIDSAEISKMATAMAAIGSTAERTIKVVAAYYALFAGPGVVAAFGMWIKSQYTAASAALQLQTQVAAGNAVMLGSAQATAMKAAADAESAAMSVKNAQAQVVRTQTDIAAVQAKIALINTEKNQIMTLIQEGSVTADVTMLEQRFAVATKAAAAAQLELRNVTAANTQAQAALAAATTKATAATEASAVAAKAASASVLTLGNAINILFAGIVGWQIGKWLTDNFEWARVAGIHFIDDTIKGWYLLEKEAKIALSGIKNFWNDEFKQERFQITMEFRAKEAERGKIIAEMLAEASGRVAKGMDKVTDAEQGVIDRLLPLQALQKKYQEDLKLLESWYKKNSDKTAEYQIALQRLNEEYEKSKAALTGSKAPVSKLADAHQNLLDRLIPLQALQREYRADLALLNDWYSKNKDKSEEYKTALDNLNKSFAESREAITIEGIREQADAMQEAYEERIRQEELLQEAMFNRIELEKGAIDIAEQAKQITGAEAAQKRIEVLNQEIEARQKIHDSIIGSSAEATIARQEELLAMQQLNMEIAEQQAMLADTTWLGGAKAAWEEYARAALDAGSQAKNFFSNTFQSLEDTVMDFVNTGTFAFEEFAKSVLADLTRIYIRAILVRSVMGFMGGGGGGMLHDGLAAGDTPKFHNGMSPTYQPPRFHDGLKPDEFPAILQVGERVTSKKDVQSQNQQLADYEQWKKGGGGEQGGGMAVSVPINIDPSYSKKFRSDMQRSIEDTVLKVVKRFS